MRRVLASLFGLAVVGYIAGCGVLWENQRYLVFHDAPWKGLGQGPAPSARGFQYEDVRFETSDHLSIAGWLTHADDPDAPTVLFFHGKGCNVTALGDFIAMWHGLGWQSLVVDYRGFGESEGEPTEAGVYLDGDAAWRFLTEERGIPADRIIVWGHSLGGGTASKVAADHLPKALVLESTFTTLPDLGQERYWFLPIKLLSSWRFDNRARIAQVRCPVVIAHSPDDERIAFHFGQELFAAAKEPKLFLRTRGGHNDGLKTDPDGQQQLVQFLSARH